MINFQEWNLGHTSSQRRGHDAADTKHIQVLRWGESDVPSSTSTYCDNILDLLVSIGT